MPITQKILLIFISIFLILSCDTNTTSESCNPNPCKLDNQSICTPTDDGSYTCNCDDGYKLDNNGYFCIKSSNDACATYDCSNKVNTHCELFGNSAMCACNTGYSVVDGECVAKSPCSSNPCAKNSSTHKTFCGMIDRENYSCSCDIGYKPSGESCIKATEFGTDYDNLGNSTNIDLINKLYNLVKDHNSLTYNNAKRKIGGSGGIDVINGKIECAYSGIMHNSSSWDGAINCEHVWPQSYFEEYLPMRSDLHHLFAVTSNINSKRGNIHFGKVKKFDCPAVTDKTCSRDDDCGNNVYECNNGYCEKVFWALDWDGIYDGKDTGCRKGVPSTNCNDFSVFEVRDEIKGDVARALFYFAVRYKDERINESQGGMTGPGNTNHIPPYEEKYLRAWNHLDPVDEKEYERNNKIDAIQHNRNPFIDRPDLADRISDF